jgi:hypothetical protein
LFISQDSPRETAATTQDKKDAHLSFYDLHNIRIEMAVKTATSRLEAIAVDDWPGVDIGEPALAENWTEGLA